MTKTKTKTGIERTCSAELWALSGVYRFYLPGFIPHSAPPVHRLRFIDEIGNYLDAALPKCASLK